MVMKRILLVDDSKLILKIAAAMLGSRYEVITAGSAAEALDSALTHHPHMVLTDLNLEGPSGQQLRDTLLSDQRTRDICTVIVTTEGELKRLGPGVDHLVKPFDQSSLLGKVQQYLH